MPKIEYYVYMYSGTKATLYTKTTDYNEAINFYNSFKNLGYDKIELVKKVTGEKPKTLESYTKGE